jgi:hypothetical protein
MAKTPPSLSQPTTQSADGAVTHVPHHMTGLYIWRFPRWAPELFPNPTANPPDSLMNVWTCRDTFGGCTIVFEPGG